jgi:hypothetical protein
MPRLSILQEALDDNPARIGLIRTPTGARIRNSFLGAESGLRDGPDLYVEFAVSRRALCSR